MIDWKTFHYVYAKYLCYFTKVFLVCFSYNFGLIKFFDKTSFFFQDKYLFIIGKWNILIISHCSKEKTAFFTCHHHNFKSRIRFRFSPTKTSISRKSTPYSQTWIHTHPQIKQCLFRKRALSVPYLQKTQIRHTNSVRASTNFTFPENSAYV